jgi:hypothetical protein
MIAFIIGIVVGYCFRSFLEYVDDDWGRGSE